MDNYEIYRALEMHDLEADDAHHKVIPDLKRLLVSDQETFEEMMVEATCYMNKEAIKLASDAVGNLLFREQYMKETGGWSSATSTAVFASVFLDALEKAMTDYAERSAEEYVDIARGIKRREMGHRDVLDARREALGA